jgi:DNA-binding MarR family transcriptional regulator
MKDAGRSVARTRRGEELTVNESSSGFPFDALETQLRCVDLIGWAQITARAEQLDLTFVDLRLLLALAAKSGISSVGDLARLSGLSPEAAYQGVNHLHGRGYLHETQRRYELSEDGRELVASLDGAHRQGIRAYIDGLDAHERRSLEDALRIAGR